MLVVCMFGRLCEHFHFVWQNAVKLCTDKDTHTHTLEQLAGNYVRRYNYAFIIQVGACVQTTKNIRK